MIMLTRRRFLTSAAATAGAISPFARAADAKGAFSFILLGDLHFDRWEHHDLKWLEAHKAGDLSQIRNYTKLTAEVMPQVFAAVKARIAALRSSATPPAFVLQVGDLVEGLCGSEELAARQNREAVEFVTQAELGVPFLFTKGNHDVTGEGAVAAFNAVLQPWMKAEAGKIDAKAAQTGANFTATHGDAQFAFFDAYDKSSLEWLEAVAQARTAGRLFVTVHPPVVPYGARATWHLYAADKAKAQREKLLQILARQEAIVLGGHLHKFSHVTRKVADGGAFTQLAVSSVVSAPNQKVNQELTGTAAYNGDQVTLEPKHAPETEAERRAVYERERAFVTDFQFADTAGYAVVTVAADRVEAQVHAGTAGVPFRTVRLA
jgi:UDP-2,3-diacylglucosamine pyrophosphatase LpxH